MTRLVFVGPRLSVDTSKPILYRAQCDELGDTLSLGEASALLAATLDDPTGLDRMHEMQSILLGLQQWDGLDLDKDGRNFKVRREALLTVKEKLSARLGDMPAGLAAWLGEPVTTCEALPIVAVTTRRLKELLARSCSGIDNIVRKYSEYKWLQPCATPDPNSERGDLLWDYWVTVETLRNKNYLSIDPPDPKSVSLGGSAPKVSNDAIRLFEQKRTERCL